MSDLAHWMQQAKVHWREFQPDLYREANSAGTLDELLKDAAERTKYEMGCLTRHGMSEQDAWETVRQEYLFPPPKKVQQPPVASLAAQQLGPPTAMQSSAMRAFLTGGIAPIRVSARLTHSTSAEMAKGSGGWTPVDCL